MASTANTMQTLLQSFKLLIVSPGNELSFLYELLILEHRIPSLWDKKPKKLKAKGNNILPLYEFKTYPKHKH